MNEPVVHEQAGWSPKVVRMCGEDARRCRVLVVKSGRLRDRVAAAVEAARLSGSVDVEASPSYLSAMGWLTGRSGGGIDAIVGPVSAMTGMVGSTAKALRKLCPGARLVVVAEADQLGEAKAAVDAGFDACVPMQADATALLGALRLPVRVGEAAADTQEQSPLVIEEGRAADSSGADIDASEKAVERAGERFASDREASRSGENNTEEAGRVVVQPGWLGPDQTAEAEEIELSGAVGDVDLAEAVLRGDGTLLALALRLIREQSGIADVSFVGSEASEQASSEGSALVVWRGRTLGRLATRASGTQALVPWAAWLARWVALERRQRDLYAMAMRDQLTGLWNRRYFDTFLKRLLQRAKQGRQQVSLLVFDIDDFKMYNDKYGHPAGDEILQSTATLIQSLVREHDVVARIGGDEFAVIFWDKGEPRHLGSQHPHSVIGIAKRFQKAICEHRFPKLGEEAVGRLTVSGGLAGYPWDGATPEQLIEHADNMAIASKRQGKNAICFGQGVAPAMDREPADDDADGLGSS